MTLHLLNNLTKNEYNFTGLTDNLESRLFYSFDISLPQGIDDGEYSYTLADEDNVVVASGLLQVGDYKPQTNQYTSSTTEYKVYNG